MMWELNPIPFQNQNGEYFPAQRLQESYWCGMCILNSSFRTDPLSRLTNWEMKKKKKNPWLINQRKGLINGLIFNFKQHITYIAKVKIFIYRILIFLIAENFPFNFINIYYAINYIKKIKIWTHNYCEFVKI
jgi:hypothetical protein